MKSLLSALFVVGLAATGSAATLTETIDRTFDVRPGSTLRLTNTNGRITVAAWDQQKIRVVAVKTAEGDSDQLKDYMKKLRVDIQAKDGGLVVATYQPKQTHSLSDILDHIFGDDVNGQVRYEVTVPRAMNVALSNTNGAIRLSDVSGKLALATTNGGIDVVRCGGSVAAATTNGSISAQLVNVTRGEKLDFETTNGRISVAVPGNFAGELDANTTNGSIKSDFAVTTKSSEKNRLRGTVNGGGATLRAQTTNGGIEIRKI